MGVWLVRGATRVGDAVGFEVPGGRLVGWRVMRDLQKIFAFRKHELAKLLA